MSGVTFQYMATPIKQDTVCWLKVNRGRFQQITIYPYIIIFKLFKVLA